MATYTVKLYNGTDFVTTTQALRVDGETAHLLIGVRCEDRLTGRQVLISAHSDQRKAGIALRKAWKTREYAEVFQMPASRADIDTCRNCQGQALCYNCRTAMEGW